MLVKEEEDKEMNINQWQLPRYHRHDTKAPSTPATFRSNMSNVAVRYGAVFGYKVAHTKM